jgi:hypothetical protein
VRQLSIADITFDWPRLTWPALALRHAAPWSRKISATSNPDRLMTLVYAGGSVFLVLRWVSEAICRMAMSSIMRWRSGVMRSSVMRCSCLKRGC